MSPRTPNINIIEATASIETLNSTFKSYPILTDPRLHSVFWHRAKLRWARGDSVEVVLADLRSSALCLRGQADIRLFKLEPERLRSRRIDPLHLAALHPDPDVLETFGREYGLPLATWYAGAGSRPLEEELRVLSGFFSRLHPPHEQKNYEIRASTEMVGLSAATYAAAFGYLAAGDYGSAAVVLTMISALAESLDTPPPDAAKRYLRQCSALAAIHGRDADALSEALILLLNDVHHDANAPDLVIPALVGLAMLINVEPDLVRLREHDAITWSIAAAVAESWALVE